MDNRILFRGKWKYNSEWIYGFLSGENYVSRLEEIDFLGDVEQEYIGYEVISGTVGQCTGLSAAKSYRGDKPEDLLIFEGDIVRRKCSIYKLAVRKPIGERLVIGTVFWDEHKKLEAGGWAVKANDEHGNSTTYILLADSEIIGTIHDLDSPDKREG